MVGAVTAANIGDRDTAAGLLRRLRRLHRDITLVSADGGYTGGLVGVPAQTRPDHGDHQSHRDMEVFVVLPRRWVAERMFAWLLNNRRPVRDYETLPATSEAMNAGFPRRWTSPSSSGCTWGPPDAGSDGRGVDLAGGRSDGGGRLLLATELDEPQGGDPGEAEATECDTELGDGVRRGGGG
ncbi:hypothetical protein ACIP6X_34260 [Streptomyces coeruleorubidus]|uniref:hypothetical protein n=1 Tax=Streptomyces coeruleorubidus TaxID=116188 RepID=UPI003823C990